MENQFQHCIIRIERNKPKVFRQPTLIYSVTLQELPSGRGSVTANWPSVPMLDLRRFKEAIV